MALMRAATHHKGDDVGRGQVPKVQGEAIGQGPALKKEMHRIDIAAGGLGPQATLNRQVAAVSLQRHFHRTAGRGRRRCWRHSETTQVSEYRLLRFNREQVRVTSGTTSKQKPFHLNRVQRVCAAAFAHKPAAQVGQQPHLIAGGTWPITLSREFVGKASRERRKRTQYPTLRRIDQHESLPSLGKKGQAAPSVSRWDYAGPIAAITASGAGSQASVGIIRRSA